MTRMQRYDLGALRPAKRAPDGRLVVDAHITRAGIFEYTDSSGRKWRELREPEEVFHKDSLESFKLVPVTNNHPEEGEVNAKNARRYMVGSTGDTVVRDDDHVRTSLMVQDADTISQMEAGKLEVSCGYVCDVDETPGVHPKYGRYDTRQLNIRGNHVAIVDSARAGRTARVRMDGAATQTTHPPAFLRSHMSTDPTKKDETIRALGAQLTEAKERADSAETTVKTEATRADVAEGKLITAESRIAELTSQLAAANVTNETAAVIRERQRADSAEAKIARFDATLETRIRQRAKLERQVFSVMGPEFRTDDMEDRHMMAAVVKRLDSNADVGAAVPTGIIEGRFLSLLDGFNRNAQSQARVGELLNETQAEVRVDAKTTTQQRTRDQWKAPLPNDIRAKRAGKDA